MIRKKIICEICGLQNKNILHRHHIIPRKDKRSTNNDFNLAILCPNCHSKVHAGEYIIIGVYKTTDGLKPIWFKNGEDPPFSKKFWIVVDNPLIITLNRKNNDL